MSLNYREESRSNFARPGTERPSLEDIKLGCLQRIADAVEVMSANYSKLIADRDLYKRWYDEQRERTARLERRINSLKGAVTRAKRTAPKAGSSPP